MLEREICEPMTPRDVNQDVSCEVNMAAIPILWTLPVQNVQPFRRSHYEETSFGLVYMG